MQGFCDVYKWTFLKRTSPEVKCLHLTSSRREMCTSSVSYVIYHKFSNGAAFCTFNGKNVNVMLELVLMLCALSYHNDGDGSCARTYGWNGKLCHHAKCYNDAKYYKFITFCVELKFFPNAKCYKILMAPFLANFCLGEADEVRKDVFSTDTSIWTPSIILFRKISSS